ncbi:MAG: cell division protein FtsH, partial [Intestinibacter sp.]|nr:cell division protein FtsH [Intestinibacter sp.]
DEEVLSIIKSAHEKAMNILKENKEKLHELSKFLLEKETITGEEFMEILNKDNNLDTNLLQNDTNPESGDIIDEVEGSKFSVVGEGVSLEKKENTVDLDKK